MVVVDEIEREGKLEKDEVASRHAEEDKGFFLSVPRFVCVGAVGRNAFRDLCLTANVLRLIMPQENPQSTYRHIGGERRCQHAQ
jgi:hypothetical protein